MGNIGYGRQRQPDKELGMMAITKIIQVGSGRIGSGRIGSGRVGSGRVGSGRVGSGRVGSGRVGSGHFRSCMVTWTHKSIPRSSPLFPVLISFSTR